MQLRKVKVHVSEAHEVFEVRKSNKHHSQLQALRGSLGWAITGTIHGSWNISVNFVSCDKNLHYQIETFWKVEGFGTKTERMVKQIVGIKTLFCPETTCVWWTS